MSARRVPVAPGSLPRRRGAQLVLPEGAAHHVRDVLRMRVGDQVECFDGEGVAVLAIITRLDAEALTVTVERELPEDEREPPIAITLYQAPPKGERFAWILEKACELGVSHVAPVISARTIVRIKPAKHAAKLARWHKILAGAARQSGRARVPTIQAPQSFERALADADASQRHLVASPHHEATSWSQAMEGGGPVCIWIGPEGGWDPGEVEALRSRGALSVGLGPRVLRAETAAVAAITLALHASGEIQ